MWYNCHLDLWKLINWTELNWTELKLEQLERLRSEDTPRHPVITHTIEQSVLNPTVHTIDQFISDPKSKEGESRKN